MQNGMFIVERACPQCHGSGEVISDPCEHCHGEGRVERRKQLKVKIPKGVELKRVSVWETGANCATYSPS